MWSLINKCSHGVLKVTSVSYYSDYYSLILQSRIRMNASMQLIPTCSGRTFYPLEELNLIQASLINMYKACCLNSSKYQEQL